MLSSSNAKRALVTGGDKGIGRAIVERFVASGYEVVFTYNSNRQGADEIVGKYSTVKALHCDYSSMSSIQSALSSILESGLVPDAVVNNIGIDMDSTFQKMTFENWSKVININLIQLYHFSHCFISSMIEKRWGRIVNISSIGAYMGSFGKTNYAASKSGIVGFSRALAIELASKGITVNAVCPGAIETDMFYRIPQKYREQMIAEIPMKRLGQPGEVADLVNYLCSEQASFLTGQTVHINGGQYCGG